MRFGCLQVLLLASLGASGPVALAGTPATPGGAQAVLLQAAGARLLVELVDPAAPLFPGDEVGVYAADPRRDPRTGELVDGFRYAGDGTVTWRAPLVEVQLTRPGSLREGGALVIGTPLGRPPTPAWRPEPVVAEPEPLASVPAPVAEPPRARSRPLRSALAPLGRDLDGRVLGSVHARHLERFGGRRNALRTWGGFAGDGYDSGAATGGVAWIGRPRRGPARVEVGVEGLRGQRWVQGEGEGDEEWGLEPAVGYWMWSRVDSAGLGLAVFGGLGAGVDADGLALAWMAGVRTGDPDRSRIELWWEDRGGLGARAVLDGRVALADSLRLGVRARLGNLPRHDGDFLQTRADGALVASVDPAPWMTVTLAGGLGGYDLLLPDAGLVADAALEVRW